MLNAGCIFHTSVWIYSTCYRPYNSPFCASNLRILITRNNWTVESLDFYTKSVLLCLNVQTVWCCFKSPCRTVLDCICTTVSFLRCTQLFLFSKWNPSDPWFERAWTLHLSTWELCSQSAVSDFIILFLTSITDARCDSSLFCVFFSCFCECCVTVTWIQLWLFQHLSKVQVCGPSRQALDLHSLSLFQEGGLRCRAFPQVNNNMVLLWQNKPAVIDAILKLCITSGAVMNEQIRSSSSKTSHLEMWRCKL